MTDTEDEDNEQEDSVDSNDSKQTADGQPEVMIVNDGFCLENPSF